MTVTAYQACPKCGETARHGIRYTGSLDGSIEFLLLKCPTCGYQHTEKCADAKGEGVKPAISDQEYFLSQIMRGFMTRPEFEAWIKKQVRINGGRFWLAASKHARTERRKNAHTPDMSLVLTASLVKSTGRSTGFKVANARSAVKPQGAQGA